MKPLRRVVWVRHPVIELENVLNIAKRDRVFTLLVDSEPCEYEMGIFLKYQTGIYGEKIARISSDGDESLKSQLQDEFSPRTKEIYNMLEGELLQAVHAAVPLRKKNLAPIPCAKVDYPDVAKIPIPNFKSRPPVEPPPLFSSFSHAAWFIPTLSADDFRAELQKLWSPVFVQNLIQFQ